jgi:pYEATS domain-containing protein involved in immunity
MATLVDVQQSERALRSLLYAMLLTMVGLLIYALTSKSWSAFGSTLGTGLMVAASALVIGGLLGFLFGIPRTLQQQAVPVANNTSPDPNAAATTSGNKPEGAEIQANTNLEQVSDWVTKILVGVGLTQVAAIGRKFDQVAASVSIALGDTSGNRSFALALIIFPLILGFLFSYLWTRLYLPGAFREAEALAALKKRVEQVDLRSKDNQAAALGTGKGNAEEVTKKLLAVTDGITPGSPTDPWKGRFGGKSVDNDRQLKAEVQPILGSLDLYSIRLTVSSLHPQTSPLLGAVQFFLHPTFTNDKPVVTVGPYGVAELNLKAWGAFTVGALADDGQTKLELDLSTLETAPAQFRSR